MRPIGTTFLPIILIFLLWSCNQDPEEIQKSLKVQKVPKTTYTEAQDSVRFHDTFSPGQPHKHQHPAKSEQLFDFLLPDGWSQAPSTEFRQINITFSTEPKAACYLTVLPLKGGDLLQNLNRWRGQFELPSLPTLPDNETEQIVFLGATSTLYSLAGNFTELGYAGKDFAAICMLQSDQEKAYSIKFTGPSDFIKKEKDHFISWVQSIKKITKEDSPAKIYNENASSIKWETPQDWSIAPEKPMRLVTFQTKNNLECSISFAGGTAIQNINRWRTQMGLPTAETLDQQEKEMRTAPIGEVICLFLEGNYTGGMSDKPVENAIMAGALVIRPTDSVFIKMVGSKEVVLQEKDAFYQLIQSIRESK